MAGPFAAAAAAGASAVSAHDQPGSPPRQQPLPPRDPPGQDRARLEPALHLREIEPFERLGHAARGNDALGLRRLGRRVINGKARDWPSGGDEERRHHEERLRELSPRWRDIFEIYRALDDQQRGCLRTLVWHRKVLLVGAAGTGKTLTLSCCIRFLVDILNEETRALALMGKAAARIHQTLNDERIKCSTVHAELARMSREPLSYAIDEVGTCPTALLQRLVVDLPTDP